MATKVDFSEWNFGGDCNDLVHEIQQQSAQVVIDEVVESADFSVRFGYYENPDKFVSSDDMYVECCFFEDVMVSIKLYDLMSRKFDDFINEDNPPDLNLKRVVDYLRGLANQIENEIA